MKTRLSSLLVFVVILTTFTIPEAQAMRWYSLNTGRWFSRDPIDEVGSIVNLAPSVSDLLLDRVSAGDGMRPPVEEIKKAAERAASLTRNQCERRLLLARAAARPSHPLSATRGVGAAR